MKHLFLRSAWIALAGFAALAHAPAALASGRVVDAHYGLYWGGMLVADGRMRGDLRPGSYRLSTENQSRGVLDTLLTFQINARVQGRIDTDRLRPAAYLSRSAWNDTPRKVDLTYPPNGLVIVSATPPTGADGHDPVPEHLRAGATDPLTAMLGAMLSSAASEPCRWVAPVYDGRRRFNMRFAPAGAERLPPRPAIDFDGNAIKCTLTNERIAGLHKDEKRDSSARPPSVIWVARYARGDMWLPVKVEFPSRWGAVTGEMLSVTTTPQ